MQNPIQVKWADNEPDRLGIRQDQDHVLYVAHIPKNSTENDIRTVFENYGGVKEVDIPKDQTGYSRGYVFVKYDNVEQAILSKQALHEKNILNHQTQPLVVKFYDPKKKQITPTSQPSPNLNGSINANLVLNKPSTSQNNSGSYNNQSSGNHHISGNSRDNQSNYHSSQSQSFPSSSQSQSARNSDNYSSHREHNNNNNSYNQNGSHHTSSSSTPYRGNSGNYHGHHDNKGSHAPQNSGNFPARDGMNLGGSGHFDQQNYDNFNNNSNYQGPTPSYRDQQPPQYSGSNSTTTSGYAPPSSQTRNSNSNGSSNFSYSSSYPNNQQPVPANSNSSSISTNANTPYAYNHTLNPHHHSIGNDYNYQQIPPEYPTQNNQSAFSYVNDYQSHHSTNNNNNNANNNNSNIPSQIISGPSQSTATYPPFNPAQGDNYEHSQHYANPQNNNDQPPFNNSQVNSNPTQQHPQYPHQEQQPIYQQQANNTNQPDANNPQFSQTLPPPQQSGIEPQPTEPQVPPLGSIIYNSEGIQEHVQPESIEQLQKFQLETGMSENKELEILSQKTTGPPGANLFIFHLPNDYRDSDLLRLFKKFGDLLSARVITRPDGSSKGYGFVSYTHPDGAQQAINNMNGLQVGKKKLKVEVKKGQGDDCDLQLSMHQNNFQPF